MGKNVKLLGTSTYLPGDPIKFDDINDYLGPFTNAPTKIQKWVKRTQPIMKEMLGIEYCHYAFNNKTRSFDEDNLSMSVKAAKKAIEQAGIEPKDIDLLIYGGAYSHQIPPMSTRIQEELGIGLCGELHIHSNCTSVYKGIKVADALLRTGEYKNALVVSSIVVSSCFIPEFYNQEKIKKEDIFLRWYLCDGAGAFVLSADDEQKNGFYLEDTYIESCGDKMSAMGNKYPYHWSNPMDEYDNCYHHIGQLYISEFTDQVLDKDKKTIFFTALKRMLAKKQIDLSKLKYFVVNMPSKAIVENITQECVQIGIPEDKFYTAIKNIGYAGPPAALISIDNLLREKTFEDGDLVFSFVLEASKFMQAGFTLRYYK